MWEVVPYILITIAEVCISVVGLELAFSAAPPTMKSFVTACWLLTVFFANILNSLVTPLYGAEIPTLGITLSPGLYFGLFAGLMVPVTVAFVLVARRFNRLASD
jgi:POT family proton-dependent oligopeptide transporter